jgi:hypothetical protein
MDNSKTIRSESGEFTIIDKFTYKKILCVIVKVDRTMINSLLKGVLKQPVKFDVYHNGYVCTDMEIEYQDIGSFITCVELTYSGKLDHLDKSLKGKWFLGFDTNHSWNHDHKDTRTSLAVKMDLMSLCDEITQKGGIKKIYEDNLPEIIADKL